MNVDDSRRNDSLEIQLGTFHEHPWADVVYQDIFFTLDPHLDWEVIEYMGYRTNLPPVTIPDLVMFGINAPHNAPMWRRNVHTELGYFNESLKSAGDYEFWIKCAANNKKFIKSKECHVSYYVNPDGLSTSSSSPSFTEEATIQEYWKTYFKRTYPLLDRSSHISLSHLRDEIELVEHYRKVRGRLIDDDI
jgi:hypothetical protein